jgi:hypothetical protein
MTDIFPFLEVQHQGPPAENLDTFDGDQAVPEDLFSPAVLGNAFQVENPDAFAVYERSAHDWQPNYKAIISTQSSVLLSGRVVGRKNITISVPTTWTPPGGGSSVTPAGCVIGSDQGQVDTYNGYQLNGGDSVTIATEGPVFVGPLQGASSTSYVQYIEEVNTPGGNLGNF